MVNLGNALQELREECTRQSSGFGPDQENNRPIPIRCLLIQFPSSLELRNCITALIRYPDVGSIKGQEKRLDSNGKSA